MKNSRFNYRRRSDQGVALVLVLCLIVLITGLVVAFFSRAIATRQLSNASSSAAQAEILANSATDIILGDLKQEIVNGSIAVTPAASPAPALAPLYFPKKSTDPLAVLSVGPQRNISPEASAGTPTAPGVGPIPNLVRRSLEMDDAAGDNYVPFPGVTSRASKASSSKLSLNNRAVSRARWNRHFLIPADTNNITGDPTSAASLTASEPVSEFKVPDWVIVTAEKGPQVLKEPPKSNAAPALTVVGRYAYAIYDEGGLLDINHAGFPSTSTPAHVGAKPGAGYADLTELDPAKEYLTPENVDKLLAWRNYATVQATGSFPNLQLPAGIASDNAYYRLFTSYPRSLLLTPTTVWNDKTDQRFLSRQQLIGYFAAAKLHPKFLQYLATFTRGLNQPSYLPEYARDSTSLAPIRPMVLSLNQGGNDSAGTAQPAIVDPANNPKVDGTGLTPNFLVARVLNAFQRSPNMPGATPAVVGEPLVKKRFPLNRVAWVTYKGPSRDRALGEPDIKALLDAGITEEFLKQGTAENVKLFFGLQWNPTERSWTYVHGQSGSAGAILQINNPAKATDVVRQENAPREGREPDFFELLKASINPGSIAKASIAPTVRQNEPKARAAKEQQITDTSLDIAILQIGANIIDQFDTDSFPTWINHSLAGSAATTNPRVFGVENLPYISRVRGGLIRLIRSDPIDTDNTDNTNTMLPVKDTGLAALMNIPEVWNPHDWSSTNSRVSAGSIGPKDFKIYAVSAATTSVWAWCRNDFAGYSNNSDAARSPGFLDKYHFPWGSPGYLGGEPRSLAESNTRMTFSVDPSLGQSLFREPTILFQPLVPSGSNLAAPALVSANAGTPAGLGYLAENPGVFGSPSTGGLVSAASAPPGGSDFPVAGKTYLGFYVGAHPLRWAEKTPTLATMRSGPADQTQYGPVVDVAYTLACEDGQGGWIPYDVKNLTSSGAPNSYLATGAEVGFGLNGSTGNPPPAPAKPTKSALDHGVRYYVTVDPRTNRFGMVDPWISLNTNSIPPRNGKSFADKLNGTFKTDREGRSSGAAIRFGTLMGDQYGANDWFSKAMGWYHEEPTTLMADRDSFRMGLFSQNNPKVFPDRKIADGSALPFDYNGSGPAPAFYYADADGVVRRASAGTVPGTGPNGPAASTLTGLPMASPGGVLAGAPLDASPSRPVILNRPFRSVAELGYVYSGTPWKNLDFFQPESGNAGMLDVFCVDDASDANGLTAGQVNLNTRQVPVLQAILARANKDQWSENKNAATSTAIMGGAAGAQAQVIAQRLVNRTTIGFKTGPVANQGPQPLQNVSDLVGRLAKPVTGQPPYDGQTYYDGLTAELAEMPDADDANRHRIQRFGETAIRALANVGQTRVWNLMFDIVAQTGRYPRIATTLDQFNVEGEQRYWVHVAIDRYTGQVLDKQVEIVKE